MANLTLSLNDQLLQKAREAAVRDQTSVNALDMLADRNHSASSEAWSRESLHQRHSS